MENLALPVWSFLSVRSWPGVYALVISGHEPDPKDARKAWVMFPLARWMSAVRSRHRLPPPGGAMRAYQTTGHLPIAVAQAFVLTRPPRGVGTSAQAISSLI